MNLIPAIGSRMIIAGKTGTGKTTLARLILQHYHVAGEQIVIVDPKGTFKFPGVIVQSSEEVYDQQDEQVLIYRPNVDNDIKTDIAEYERVFKYILKKGQLVGYCDELYATAPDNYTYPNSIRGIYTRGREFDITMLGATQRPVSIPKVTYTEVEYAACFELRTQSDRDRMSEAMGNEVKTKANGHNFWYLSPELETAQYIRLNL